MMKDKLDNIQNEIYEHLGLNFYAGYNRYKSIKDQLDDIGLGSYSHLWITPTNHEGVYVFRQEFKVSATIPEFNQLTALHDIIVG